MSINKFSIAYLLCLSLGIGTAYAEDGHNSIDQKDNEAIKVLLDKTQSQLEIDKIKLMQDGSKSYLNPTIYRIQDKNGHEVELAVYANETGELDASFSHNPELSIGKEQYQFIKKLNGVYRVEDLAYDDLSAYRVFSAKNRAIFTFTEKDTVKHYFVTHHKDKNIVNYLESNSNTEDSYYPKIISYQLDKDKLVSNSQSLVKVGRLSLNLMQTILTDDYNFENVNVEANMDDGKMQSTLQIKDGIVSIRATHMENNATCSLDLNKCYAARLGSSFRCPLFDDAPNSKENKVPIIEVAENEEGNFKLTIIDGPISYCGQDAYINGSYITK